MTMIKFADLGEISGIAIPFGSPDRRDRHNEFFTAATDLALPLVTDRPVLLDHGLTDSGPEVVGRVVEFQSRAEGVWVRVQLDRAGKWFQRVKDLLAQGALSFSSGAIGHLVRTAKDGHIERWPWVELSLVQNPASWDARIYTVKASDLAAHVKALAPASSDLAPDDRLRLDLIAVRLDFDQAQRAASERQYLALVREHLTYQMRS